jgi:hypothetical protein
LRWRGKNINSASIPELIVMKRSLTFLLLPLFSLTVQAQQSAPANKVLNGGFEQVSPEENLWDGVDSDGCLAGWRASATTLNPNGGRSDIAMPISVNCLDLNGDKIMDIVTADPAGFYRVYFGSGTPQDPKYTHCEMIPLYVSREGHSSDATRIPKIALFDWNKRGLSDLTIGNYIGQVLLIPNTGSAQNPEFRQPADLSRITIPTGNKLWCILPSPAVWDMNGDGSPDLLLGEGSYSANAIHILLNRSSSNVPKFDETGRFYLAYGDGREVLTPTVVDYNGDGLPDVVVGASDGKVCVYLNPGNWKAGMEFKMASEISFGGSTTIGGVVAPYAADINQDGLFDLIIGKNNGRIALAINKGTKQEPKFDRPEEIRGGDVWKRDINTPAGWTVDNGGGKGNMFAVVSSVNADEDKDAQPAEGKRALKLGYLTPLNKVVKFTPVDVLPKKQEWPREIFRWVWNYAPGNASVNGEEMSTNTFGAMREMNNLVPGKSYTLTFKAKGRNFTGRWLVAAHGYGQRSPKKITRMERGAAAVVNDASNEELKIDGNFSPGPAWTTVTRSIELKFRDTVLNSPEKWGDKFKGMKAPTYRSIIYFVCEVKPPDGVCYIDDVSITEKAP